MRPTFNQNSEFFAHIFAANMINAEESLANVSHFFPSASIIIEDVMANAAKELETINARRELSANRGGQ